jgi:hypothetical protein
VHKFLWRKDHFISTKFFSLVEGLIGNFHEFFGNLAMLGATGKAYA